MEEIRSFWGGGEGGGGGVKRKRKKKGPSKYCVSVSVSPAPAEPLMWFTGWIKEGGINTNSFAVGPSVQVPVHPPLFHTTFILPRQPV